jgi:Carboxypeptidase regulatory-like domain
LRSLLLGFLLVIILAMVGLSYGNSAWLQPVEATPTDVLALDPSIVNIWTLAACSSSCDLTNPVDLLDVADADGDGDGEVEASDFADLDLDNNRLNQDDGELWILAFVSDDQSVYFDADEGVFAESGYSYSTLDCPGDFADEDCDNDKTRGDGVVVATLAGNGVAGLGEAIVTVTQSGVDVELAYTVVGDATGSISGTVTNGNGDPLGGCDIYADTWDGAGIGGWAPTNDGGSFTVANLATDDYRVQAQCDGYGFKYYDNATVWGDADPVAVVNGQGTPNINFSLGVEGTISGTVTDTGGSPLDNCMVVASSWDGNHLTLAWPEDGIYTVGGLATGNYRVAANCSGYADEYYDDALESDDADPVTVVEGLDTPSIDFELAADGDNDEIPDEGDNCPSVSNFDQLNGDGGRRPNGPQIINDWASNPVKDAFGDACDNDDDNDGVLDVSENELSCPYRLQADSDGDRIVDGYEVSMSTDTCDDTSKPPPCVTSTDSDSDGLTDCIEHSGYNMCAFTGDTTPVWSACADPTDSDGDGCADVLEVMDINGDRKVTIADQTLLAKRAVNIFPASPESDPIFDVNKSGTITVGDQTLMAKNTCALKPGLIGCEGDQVCPAE